MSGLLRSLPPLRRLHLCADLPDLSLNAFLDFPDLVAGGPIVHHMSVHVTVAAKEAVSLLADEMYSVRFIAHCNLSHSKFYRCRSSFLVVH